MNIPQPECVEESKIILTEKQSQTLHGLARMIGFLKREGEIYNDGQQEDWFTAQKDIFLTVCQCLLNENDMKSIKLAMENGDKEAVKKGAEDDSLFTKITTTKQ